MKRRIAFLLIGTMLLSLQVPINAQEVDSAYFVSPIGNDENDGSYSAPFRTFEKAQMTIRDQINSDEIPDGGVTVYFREGVYEFRDNGIKLTSSDSGTEKSPITYSAYNNENVQFVGGIQLKQQDFRRTVDETVLNRIYDETAREYIYEYDLIELKDYIKREIPCGVYWGEPVYIPNLLIRDDNLESIARWPNNDEKYFGFAAIEELISAKAIKMNEIYTDRMKGWKKKDWSNMFIHSFIEGDWRDSSNNVERVSGNIVTVKGAHTMNETGKKGKEIAFVNLLPELDRPGEYFVDVDNFKLYYFPPKESGKNSKFFLTTLNETLCTVNAQNINFKGITFNGSNLKGISVENAKNVDFNFCDVLNMGSVSATFGTSETKVDAINCGIRNSTIKNCGGSALYTYGGSNPTLEKGGCYIENCDVSNWGIFTMCYNCGIQLLGCANKAINNKFHNGPHMLMWSGGTLNEFAYNDIYDVVKYCADSGAVYMINGVGRLGNDLHNNWFHDCVLHPGKINSVYGIRAFYFDEYESGKITRNNLITNFDGYGILVNGGSYNKTENNIIYKSKHSPIAVQDGPSGTNFIVGQASKVAGWVSTLNNIENDDWYTNWPFLKNVMGSNAGLMMGNETTKNVAVDSPDFDLKRTNDSARHLAEDNIHMDADDIFVDAENNDFNIKPDSPVYKEIEGFQDIEFSKIGLITDKALSPVKNSIVLALNCAGVLNNGKLSLIDDTNYKVKPIIEEDSTFVPVRFISEALGSNVNWDESTHTVTIEGEGKTVQFQIGSSTYYVNGEVKSINASARVIEGRTFIPIRACSEALDKSVAWNEAGLIIIGDSDRVFDDEEDSSEIEYLINMLHI